MWFFLNSIEGWCGRLCGSWQLQRWLLATCCLSCFTESVFYRNVTPRRDAGVCVCVWEEAEAWRTVLSIQHGQLLFHVIGDAHTLAWSFFYPTWKDLWQVPLRGSLSASHSKLKNKGVAVLCPIILSGCHASAGPRDDSNSNRCCIVC